METTISLPAEMSPSPYAAYPYAYPHKTAYRPLAPPVPLDALWAGEDRRALFDLVEDHGLGLLEEGFGPHGVQHHPA